MYPVAKGLHFPAILRTFQDAASTPSFLSVSLDQLSAMDAAEVDELPFGVVGMAPDGTTEVYNTAEAAVSGLTREAVLGRPFFLSIGVCMNNFLVAQRLEDTDELDVVLDYVLTYRMRPTPVRVRLLKAPTARHRFVLVQG